ILRRTLAMNGVKLKNTVASIVILGHFLLIPFLFLMMSLDGFTFKETTTTLAIMLPVTAAYVSTIVKDIIANRSATIESDEQVSVAYYRLALGLPLAFLVYNFAIIGAKGFNYGILDFEQFKAMLTLGEGAFGVYLGQIIHSLYGSRKVG